MVLELYFERAPTDFFDGGYPPSVSFKRSVYRVAGSIPLRSNLFYPERGKIIKLNSSCNAWRGAAGGSTALANILTRLPPVACVLAAHTAARNIKSQSTTARPSASASTIIPRRPRRCRAIFESRLFLGRIFAAPKNPPF